MMMCVCYSVGNNCCLHLLVHRPNVKHHRARQETEDEGINQIIKIHTDRHRSVLAEIDDAIRTVLETGELPLFENGKSYYRYK